MLNTDGVLTASEHTTRHTQCRAVWLGYLGLMSLAMAWIISDNSYLWRGNLHILYMYNMASYCSVCNIEVTDDGEALECDEC